MATYIHQLLGSYNGLPIEQRWDTSWEHNDLCFDSPQVKLYQKETVHELFLVVEATLLDIPSVMGAKDPLRFAKEFLGEGKDGGIDLLTATKECLAEHWSDLLPAIVLFLTGVGMPAVIAAAGSFFQSVAKCILDKSGVTVTVELREEVHPSNWHPV